MTTRDFTISKFSFARDRGNLSFKLKKIKYVLAFFIIAFVFFACFLIFQRTYCNDFYKDISVADFRFNINQLSLVAKVIESTRTSNSKSDVEIYGTEGKPLTIDEIRPELKAALVKVADIDNDR